MFVIIVAGGVGLRMKTDIPKQFMEICGKPVIFHSIMAFLDACEGVNLVIVLCPSQMERWRQLCEIHNFMMPHQIAQGGATRFHSVKNGLSLIPDKGLVAIHDAVRPLVSRQTIINCFSEAEKYGSAVPTIPVVDTIREVSQQTNRTLNRSSLRQIQTPQVFDIARIKKAYQQEYSEAFTDCASVFESDDNTVHLTNGNIENIKITTQNDLVIAEALFSR